MVWPEYICLFFLTRPQFEKINTKNFPLIVLFSGFSLLFFAHDYEKVDNEEVAKEISSNFLFITVIF